MTTTVDDDPDILYNMDLYLLWNATEPETESTAYFDLDDSGGVNLLYKNPDDEKSMLNQSAMFDNVEVDMKLKVDDEDLQSKADYQVSKTDKKITATLTLNNNKDAECSCTDKKDTEKNTNPYIEASIQVDTVEKPNTNILMHMEWYKASARNIEALIKVSNKRHSSDEKKLIDKEKIEAIITMNDSVVKSNSNRKVQENFSDVLVHETLDSYLNDYVDVNIKGKRRKKKNGGNLDNYLDMCKHSYVDKNRIKKIKIIQYKIKRKADSKENSLNLSTNIEKIIEADLAMRVGDDTDKNTIFINSDITIPKEVKAESQEESVDGVDYSLSLNLVTIDDESFQFIKNDGSIASITDNEGAGDIIANHADEVISKNMLIDEVIAIDSSVEEYNSFGQNSNSKCDNEISYEFQIISVDKTDLDCKITVDEELTKDEDIAKDEELTKVYLEPVIDVSDHEDYSTHEFLEDTVDAFVHFNNESKAVSKVEEEILQEHVEGILMMVPSTEDKMSEGSLFSSPDYYDNITEGTFVDVSSQSNINLYSELKEKQTTINENCTEKNCVQINRYAYSNKSNLDISSVENSEIESTSKQYSVLAESIVDYNRKIPRNDDEYIKRNIVLVQRFFATPTKYETILNDSSDSIMSQAIHEMSGIDHLFVEKSCNDYLHLDAKCLITDGKSVDLIECFVDLFYEMIIISGQEKDFDLTRLTGNDVTEVDDVIVDDPIKEKNDVRIERYVDEGRQLIASLDSSFFSYDISEHDIADEPEDHQFLMSELEDESKVPQIFEESYVELSFFEVQEEEIVTEKALELQSKYDQKSANITGEVHFETNANAINKLINSLDQVLNCTANATFDLEQHENKNVVKIMRRMSKGLDGDEHSVIECLSLSVSAGEDNPCYSKSDVEPQEERCVKNYIHCTLAEYEEYILRSNETYVMNKEEMKVNDVKDAFTVGYVVLSVDDQKPPLAVNFSTTEVQGKQILSFFICVIISIYRVSHKKCTLVKISLLLFQL